MSALSSRASGVVDPGAHSTVLFSGPEARIVPVAEERPKTVETTSTSSVPPKLGTVAEVELARPDAGVKVRVTS